MQARVAWFIMVHHKPDQLAWLLNALDDPTETIIIHVDLKSRLGLKKNRRGLMKAVRALCADRPNVHFLRSRFTNWGGWSLSKALLDGMRLALRVDPAWTHFVNLSGQCYPLKPLGRIRREMADSARAVMVEMRSFGSLPADDWHLKWHPMLETPLRAVTLPGRRRPPSNFALTCKGSQWVVLPRAFCDWAASARLTRRVSGYLRHLLLSDELVMQALALNGPFRDDILPYRRHIVWPGPKVLTIADLPAMERGNAWFGRKFDLATDVDVLTALAAQIGAPSGPGPAIPTG